MNKDYFLPKMDLSLVRKVFLVLLFSITIFSFGYFLGGKGVFIGATSISDVTIDRVVPQNKNVEFDLFWKVWDALEKDYFDKTKLNAQKMVYGAISGMVAAVGDPYTSFLPPDQNKIVEEDLSGSFSGVGIQIGFRGTQLAVVAPLPGSPAEKSGIRAGDFIIGIKDESKSIDTSTAGMSLSDAVSLIRGEKGSVVTLALTREESDEPLIVDITREEIEVPSVTVDFVGEGGDIAHIKLMKFSSETKAEWDKAVSTILTKNVKGIVIDLRNNPGGYLQAAVDVAGDYLPNGSVVVIEEFSNGEKNSFKTDRIPRLANYNTMLLVNKGSASASEILSGALREKKGIELVGETTFGKGTIQEPRQINGGSSLHITTARWLTPNENWVNEKGLEPDHEVLDNIKTTEDEQLQEILRLF